MSNKNKVNFRAVLTAREVADLLEISISHVYENLRRGDLPSVTVGRRIVIPARPIFTMLGLDDVKTPLRGVSGGA